MDSGVVLVPMARFSSWTSSAGRRKRLRIGIAGRSSDMRWESIPAMSLILSYGTPLRSDMQCARCGVRYSVQADARAPYSYLTDGRDSGIAVSLKHAHNSSKAASSSRRFGGLGGAGLWAMRDGSPDCGRQRAMGIVGTRRPKARQPFEDGGEMCTLADAARGTNGPFVHRGLVHANGFPARLGDGGSQPQDHATSVYQYHVSSSIQN